jgi:hypothetical protein
MLRNGHVRLYVNRPNMLTTGFGGLRFRRKIGHRGAGAFNIIIGPADACRVHVLRDPIGGIDGQEGVVPGGVGAVGSARGGVRRVVGVPVVFTVGCGE